MSDLITMDDLSNDEILEILDTAERLLPVAMGDAVSYTHMTLQTICSV